MNKNGKDNYNNNWKMSTKTVTKMSKNGKDNYNNNWKIRVQKRLQK